MISALLCLGIACGDYVPTAEGRATWYDATRQGQSTWYTRQGIQLYAAAGPRLRRLVDVSWRMEPVAILVESVRTGRKVVAWVVDWCQCRGGSGDERLVDLAPAVWRALGVDPARGVMKVLVTVP
jgi:hypothetical protein